MTQNIRRIAGARTDLTRSNHHSFGSGYYCILCTRTQSTSTSDSTRNVLLSEM